jgi:hypothetical protein
MGFFRDLTGKTAVEAAGKAGDVQVQGAVEASAFFDPFEGLGQQGADQANFLTDPNLQFEFLQNNPRFKMALDNANQSTLGLAASRGRISAGDTLQQLSNNTLLSAQPLISGQKQSIGDLLNFGFNTAGNQANLRTGQAAAQAGGIVGAANARGQRAQNLFDIAAPGVKGFADTLGGGGGTAAALQAGATALFSDPKLKENIKKTGNKNGFNTFSWTWNNAANAIGLYGASSGVMADEVKQKIPEAITTERGYMKVNYNMIGVQHGD